MSNRIVIGSYTFTDNDILGGSIVMEHSAIGETLSADSLTFSIFSKHTGNHRLLTNLFEWYSTVSHQGFVIADSNIADIPYATQVSFYVDENLQGRFFVNKIVRTGENTFELTCCSAIGLLITAQHLGGIYNGAIARTVIADILSGVNYTLDDELANATVRGYLPVATKRDNLQQVLFAIGGSVKIDSNGTLLITPMSEQSTGEIGADRIYEGGSVEVGQEYSGVELTEHNYFISQEEKTLYDDSIEGRQLITFDEPYHSFTITGGTIVSSGANYCLVQSNGTSSAIVLTGKKYTHVQRIVTAGDTTVTGSENILQVPAAFLANPEIADMLATRVWNFIKCNVHIKQDIVVANERAGDVIQMLNPYTYQVEQALIESININISKKNKGTTDCLIGYTPEGVVSGFHYSKLFSANASWYKSGDYVYVGGQALKDENGQPVAVDKMRIILVGGGSGGNKANNGANGNASSASFERYYTSSSRGSGYRVRNVVPNAGTGGNGGNGANGGEGGRIYEISLNVANGDSGNITIGSGGAGSTATGTNGGAGSPTTFTKGNAIYSSNSGKQYPYGYVESKSGLTFANKGTAGKKGGNGGDGAQNESATGTNGGNVSPYTGGRGSSVDNWSQGSQPQGRSDYLTYGAGGGGASGSANGTNAYRNNGANGVNGGNGANATNYGGGGSGGHGGGGGGGGSIELYEYDSILYNSWDANVYNGTGGTGGTGGNGGNGKAGCLVIYY